MISSDEEEEEEDNDDSDEEIARIEAIEKELGEYKEEEEI